MVNQSRLPMVSLFRRKVVSLSVFSNYESENLYVATDVGIFQWDTNSPGSGWIQVIGTMPFKLVTDLEKDYVSDRLIAGTYGRGIWIANLCYDAGNPVIVENSVQWTVDKTICNDIIVRNNSVLNISNAEISLSKMGTIFVEDGSSLILEGGTVINANLYLEENANLTILNGGSILLNTADEVHSEPGATVNIGHGSIDLMN